MNLSNYRYNIHGGVDADRELESGEVVPYTLTSEEVSEVTETIQPLAIQPLRDNAKQIVNAQRDSLISGGVEHSGHTYQTDTTSITDLMGAILSGIDTTWLTADNAEVPMTATDLQGLGQAVARHKEALVFKARVHKDAIQALSTKADIDDYLTALTWD